MHNQKTICCLSAADSNSSSEPNLHISQRKEYANWEDNGQRKHRENVWFFISINTIFKICYAELLLGSLRLELCTIFTFWNTSRVSSMMQVDSKFIWSNKKLLYRHVPFQYTVKSRFHHMLLEKPFITHLQF